MNIRATLLGFCASLLLSAPAQAAMPTETIRNFNLALEGDDPSAVIQSAEALIAAAIENPDDPNARGAAFEAGTQLCLRDACARAIAAAPLMTGEGSEEVSAALGNLLVAYAEWSADPNKANDKALMQALQAVAPETPTYLTISAFDRYHFTKLEAGDLSDLRKVAELAAGHLKPVWNIVPANWASMELSAIAASFARNRDTAILDRLAKLEVALYPYHLASAKERPELDALYYQTFAWRYAIEAVFNSNGTRASRLVKEAAEHVSEETKAIRKAYYKDRERPPSGCTGGFLKAPEPVYPARALRDGYVGAVIVGFDIVDGKMENARVLAAVPDRQFEEAVMKSMETMEWYFDEEQKNPDCSRTAVNSPGGIIPFMFNRASTAFVSKD